MELNAFVRAVRRLAREADEVVARLSLPEGQWALNVHSYAMKPYVAFLRRYYADAGPRVGTVAMNPGRNGAVRTGIPFTDVEWARRILPRFDALVGAPPRPLPPPGREMSGRRLLGWGLGRFGTQEDFYRRLLFYITCPIAVLTKDPVRNVPLPELRGSDARHVFELVVRHTPDLVAASEPSGIVLMGRYAEKVWDALDDPRLQDLPVARTFHPAARVTKRAFRRAMDEAYDAVAP